MGDAPFKVSGDIESVKLHPVVLFSILDHYMRRNDGQRRVIGTLLGQVVGKSLEIQNCFPVPHVEKGEEVAVGKDFNREMNDLHQKVNSNEEMIGWYATALDYLPEDEESPETPSSADLLINTQSCLIHDYYSSECEQPLHLVVDTNLTNNRLGIKAFLSSPLSAGERPLAAVFKQLSVEILCDEPEKIGVDMMLQGKDLLNNPGKPQSIDSEMCSLEKSIQSLYNLLDGVHSYVEKVASGKQKPDPQIGDKIANVIASVPKIQPQVFAKSFHNNLKDMLMLVYLSNMTRTQLAVAQRLNNTVG